MISFLSNFVSFKQVRTKRHKVTLKNEKLLLLFRFHFIILSYANNWHIRALYTENLQLMLLFGWPITQSSEGWQPLTRLRDWSFDQKHKLKVAHVEGPLVTFHCWNINLFYVLHNYFSYICSTEIIFSSSFLLS